jgi:hypothetical protein
MAAPDYVPPVMADKPRPTLPIPPPGRWVATRPADLPSAQPRGRRLGSPGPDQGYALLLVQRFHGKLALASGEDEHDAIAGAVAVAMRRASIFGRAPILADLELAFGLFGFLDHAPADLVEWRRSAFRGAGHDYWDQRDIVDRIPETTLRMSPAEVRRRQGDWKQLAGVDK